MIAEDNTIEGKKIDSPRVDYYHLFYVEAILRSSAFPQISRIKPIYENLTLDELKNTWMAKHNAPSIFISALKKHNIDDLRTILYEKVREIHITRYPYDNFLY